MSNKNCSLISLKIRSSVTRFELAIGITLSDSRAAVGAQ